MMKVLRVIVLLVIVPVSSFAASTHIAGSAIYQVIGRGLAWSGFSGTTGKLYVLDAPSANLGVCITVVNNNPTNARTFGMGVEYTPDQSQVTFSGFGLDGRWIKTNPFIPLTTIPASQAVSYFISANSPAHWAIQINSESGTAGGTPDTADVFAVFGTNCPFGGTSAVIADPPPTQIQGQNQWSIVSLPGAGVQATVANAAKTGVTHTATCYSATLRASTTTACTAGMVIRDGACGAGAIIWVDNLGTTNVNGATDHSRLCGLQLTGTSGNAMCIEFTGAATSCFETVSLSGFDQ